MRDPDALGRALRLRDAGFDDTAEALIVALEAEQVLVALSIQNREASLSSLIAELDRRIEIAEPDER